MGAHHTFDAIIVAGGRGSRLGGIDKPALRTEGKTLLAHAIAAVGGARRVSVVRATDDVPVDGRITRTVELPPRSGPASAIAAGLADLGPVERGAAPLVAVLAADLAHSGDAFAALQRHPVPPAADGLLAVDPEGRDQPLLAIYRTAALTEAVGARPTDGLGVSATIAGLVLERIPLDQRLCADVDDEADARAAGILLPRDPARSLEEWVADLATELGAPELADLDLATVLDLARDAAHSVARPAAPLTTFLVGYAAARGGGSPDEIRRLAALASRRAQEWTR